MKSAKPTCKGLLITGFGPFPGVRVNPTARLAMMVAERMRQRGARACSLVLPTSYTQGLPLLSSSLAEIRPAAVLMLGLAARSAHVRVERFARDGASPTSPDAGGRLPGKSQGRSHITLSPLPHRSTAALVPALAALQRCGVPSRLSHTAGRYLCNAAYALALREMSGSDVPVLFVHVPWPRGFRGLLPRAEGTGRKPGTAALVAALAHVAQAALLRPARSRTVRIGN
jgi:pyroglutamyl-peptidase